MDISLERHLKKYFIHNFSSSFRHHERGDFKLIYFYNYWRATISRNNKRKKKKKSNNNENMIYVFNLNS